METYLMAFTYGSVVIFNASEGMQKRLLRMCRKYAKNMASEDYSEGAPANALPHACTAPHVRSCLSGVLAWLASVKCTQRFTV